MANINLKYQWCEPNGKSDKEFLGWIYQRLNAVFGERPDLEYMKRLDKLCDDTAGSFPTGPKQRLSIDITDSNLVTIKRHGKLIYED